MATPLERLQPFAGIGVGAGIGMGCGVGAASGIGGQALPFLRIPGFGIGGGCGVGFGVGWGFFLFGVGAPITRVSTMTGAEDRAMDRAYQKATEERRLGLRPPIGARAPSEGVPDPVLDRMLRLIRNRRAKRNASMRFAPP